MENNIFGNHCEPVFIDPDIQIHNVWHLLIPNIFTFLSPKTFMTNPYKRVPELVAYTGC